MAGEKKMSGEMTTLLQGQALAWNQTFNLMKSMSLKCAVELGIPDLIHSHGGTLPLSDLVKALHLHPSKARPLHRLMRFLVRFGLFSETNGGEKKEEISYTLTSLSCLFLQSEPIGAANTKFMLLVLDPIMLSPWQVLSKWFYSDYSTAFEMRNGRNFWGHVAANPEFGKVFDEVMKWDSKVVSVAVVEEGKGVFKGLKSLVDVAGGSGAMMEAVAEAFPHIHCTVLDLPHVIAAEKGGKNLEFVGGDMFEAIPPANAALLKCVVHDWDDEKSVEILKNCRRAIPSKEEGGKVIIIDMVMNDQEEDDASTDSQIFLDMEMMLLVSGAERSLKEWENLFSEAGFSGYNIVCKLGPRSLIEVYP